jgi:hypothetical protein
MLMKYILREPQLGRFVGARGELTERQGGRRGAWDRGLKRKRFKA